MFESESQSHSMKPVCDLKAITFNLTAEDAERSLDIGVVLKPWPTQTVTECSTNFRLSCLSSRKSREERHQNGSEMICRGALAETSEMRILEQMPATASCRGFCYAPSFFPVDRLAFLIDVHVHDGNKVAVLVFFPVVVVTVWFGLEVQEAAVCPRGCTTVNGLEVRDAVVCPRGCTSADRPGMDPVS